MAFCGKRRLVNAETLGIDNRKEGKKLKWQYWMTKRAFDNAHILVACACMRMLCMCAVCQRSLKRCHWPRHSLGPL